MLAPLDIKLIQRTLRIPETGIYDDFTEAAVRNFQLKNSLPLSGVVDNETAMWLLPPTTADTLVISDPEIDTPEITPTTDLSETLPHFKVNKKIIPQFSHINGKKVPNYLTPSKKEYIFLHHTAGYENPYQVVDYWAKDDRGPVVTQFIVGGSNHKTADPKYDGEIVQCMEYEDYGWHNGLGKSPLQINSIGIELCNFGFVTKDGYFNSGKWIDKTKNRFYTYIGTEVHPDQVVIFAKTWRGHRYFHRYSEQQIKSLEYLIRKIGEDNGIDIRKGLQDRLKRMDKFKAFDFDAGILSGKIKGLFLHTNVSGPNKWGGYEKWDLFPQDEVCDMISVL